MADEASCVENLQNINRHQNNVLFCNRLDVHNWLRYSVLHFFNSLCAHHIFTTLMSNGMVADGLVG